MAKRYNTILNDVDYSMTIESNGRCKLIFRKMGSDACFELDFNSIREYLIMTEELRSFFQKMIAEEEYELGLREFYFEDWNVIYLYVNDNPKDIDMSRNVYADGNLGLFSDTYWDIICSYIDEVLRWDDFFDILSMIADNVKRIVQIKVKIVNYDYFKSALKQFKQELETFPINPFTHVQYRNETITMFVKSEQELIEIEVNNIVDKDYIQNLVYERDYAYNLSQVNYWEEKVRKKKTELYQLESAYYSRNDFENWDYFDESKDEILDSIKLFEEVLSQYYEKMKPKDGCAPF